MTRIKSLSSRDLAYKINDDDHNPPHVHVEGAGQSVRINLLTAEMMDSQTGFSQSLVRRIIQTVRENRGFLLLEWEKRHGKKED